MKLSSSDPSATLPGLYRFGRKDRGVHVFRNVRLTRAGPHSVTATDVKKKAVRGTDRLSVVAGPAATLAAEGPAQANAGQAIQVTATGEDAFGNPLGDVTSNLTLSMVPGEGSCSGSSCTPTLAGSRSISASFGSARDQVPVNVVPGSLASITAEGPGQVIADEPIEVTVTGADQFGNPLGEVGAGQVTLSVSPDGACSASSCTAQASGPHTVTAGVQTASDTIDVSVLPGPPQSIQVQLPEGSTAGVPFPVSAVVRDEFSNVIPDPAPAVTFSIEPDGTCGATTCQSTVAGKKTVTASSGDLSGFEKVGNVPGPLTTIQVTSSAGAIAPPAPTGLMSDYTPNPSKPTSKTFVAAGYDFYGNYTGDMTGSTTFTISPDGSCAAAACSGALPGVHTVTGTLGANSDTESLTVDAYSDSYSMTCRGGWFDINGAMGDGCEKSTIWAPNSNRVTARSLASYDDCTENQVLVSGELFSDTRVHTPTDPEFNHSAGFEPLWFRTSADDTIGCLTNMRMWLNVSASANPSCYLMTVISTPKTNPSGSQFTATTYPGGAVAEIDYDNDTFFFFKIEKTCSAALVAEGAAFSVLAEF